jgi:hypothetical protein
MDLSSSDLQLRRRGNPHPIVWLILLLDIFIVSSSALAQADRSQLSKPMDLSSGTPEQRVACGRDVGKFCKSVTPRQGAAAYVACLVENREKLSEI